MNCVKDGLGFKIDPKSDGETKCANIGHGSTSCTTVPGYFESRTGALICDLAGFLDTKGLKQ